MQSQRKASGSTPAFMHFTSAACMLSKVAYQAIPLHIAASVKMLQVVCSSIACSASAQDKTKDIQSASTVQDQSIAAAAAQHLFIENVEVQCHTAVACHSMANDDCL